MNGHATIAFDPRDLDLFSAASHDRNPLHLSEEYARQTPLGDRVVFGVLGALAALGRVPIPAGRALSRLRIDFRQPLLVGTEYLVDWDQGSAESTRVKVLDGERLVMAASLAFREGTAGGERSVAVGEACRREPADLSLEQMARGQGASGTYAPSMAERDALAERCGLGAKGLGGDAIDALLWSSYLVGMELPGRRALFWSLDMTFTPSGAAFTGPLAYRATVARVDESLEFVEVSAELSRGGKPRAAATLRAFVRRDSPVSAPQTLRALLAGCPSLQGRVAVVIGGSRGLGAAIVQGLALQGCAVLATYRSSTLEAGRVRASVPTAPGRVELLEGDASDEQWCREALRTRVASLGRLDVLVCSASPAIRPLGLSLGELERFRSFTSAALGLVAGPMAALLEPLARSGGRCVLISSSYVRSVPREWPQYVTAKAAAEGLVNWAAARYPQVPFLVARPPRLLTDQTNTPSGRQGALGVEVAAATIIRQVAGPATGGVELLEAF